MEQKGYFEADSIVFLDGNWIRASEATTSLYAQTLHYGYGVFDGMRSYKNADGCNIFKAQEHFDRLISSAARINLTVPYSSEELVRIAYRLLEKNHLSTAYIRPLIYMGPNMELNVAGKIHIFLAAWPWNKYLGYNPIDVMVSQYKKPSDPAFPYKAKLVGNYLHSILASTQAKHLGYQEALILDQDNYIAEGSSSNFFYEKDGTLFTPKTTHALSGITRGTIIALAKQWGIPVVEKNIVVEEVYEADTAFFTGTASEVTPIGSINGETLKGKWEDSPGYNLYMMYRRMVMLNEYMDLTIV